MRGLSASRLGVRLRDEGEAKKIEAIGQATAEAYRKLNAAPGQQAITAIEVMNKVAEGNIRITPDTWLKKPSGVIDVIKGR